jgi:integrase
MSTSLNSSAAAIAGVHRRTSKGRVYYYHRKTGTRLSDDPSCHAAEVAALDAVAPRAAALSVKTLGGLIAAYKRSPEFAALAPDTAASYNRAFNAVADIADQPVTEFNARHLLTLRDAIYQTNGRWLANMAITVLSVVFGWAVPRGYAELNHAAGVPKVRRPRNLGVANPAWTAAEVEAALAAAKGGVRKGIALAFYTGMRVKDVVACRRDEWKGDRIERQSSKPGVPVTYYVVKRLAAILSEPPLSSRRRPCVSVADTLVVNRDGKPFTRGGFKVSFAALKTRLTKAGKVAPGRTFHGLRKSLGKDAAELGFSENDIAGALGHTNPASARPYTIEARQRHAAERVMRALERRGKR